MNIYEERDRRERVDTREDIEIRKHTERYDGPERREGYEYEVREEQRGQDGSERRERREKREKRKEKRGRNSPTIEEILAVGAGIREIHNQLGSRDSKGYRADVFSPGRLKRNGEGAVRGIPPSRIVHEHETDEDADWVSEDDEESTVEVSGSNVDPLLAYGGESSQGGWFGFGRPEPQRKSTIVDPRLFGPQNSLKGIVTEPVGRALS